MNANAPDQLSQKRKAGADLIVGVIILGVSIYVLIDSLWMPHYGDAGLVSSPGFTPGLIAIFMIVMSLVLIFRSRNFAWPKSNWTTESWRVLGCLAIIVAYVALMPITGYAPATFVLLATFQLVYSKKHDVKYLVVWVFGLSAVLTAALWYLFGRIFLIPLP